MLYDFYIDTVVTDVVLTDIRCMSGDIRCNILVHADDLVLLVQSLPEMNILYSKPCTSIKEHTSKPTINRDKHKVHDFFLPEGTNAHKALPLMVTCWRW